GLAVGDVKATAPGFPGQTSTQTGWAAGAGIEYALSRNWSAKVEYLHVDLGSFNCNVNCGGTPADNVSFHDHLVRGGINFRFYRPSRLYPNFGTKPAALVSMRPTNGAPTWPGKVSALLDAARPSTMRRLTRACAASEFFGKFQSGW